jgi:hypothetical protein
MKRLFHNDDRGACRFAREGTMNQDFCDRLAKALGIPKEEQAALDAGSDHPYSCTCGTCREWWRLILGGIDDLRKDVRGM